MATTYVGARTSKAARNKVHNRYGAVVTKVNKIGNKKLDMGLYKYKVTYHKKK